MNMRKLFILLIAASFCCVAFSSCNTYGLAPMEPTVIVVNNNLVYAELDQERIQNLNLAVSSCDGLTACGVINEAGDEIIRKVFQSKDDPDPEIQTVTLGETAYAHPDPRYPNLIVVLIDGKPAVFQYCNGGLSGGAQLKEMYGINGPNKIREIQIRSQKDKQKAVLEATVTAPAELEAFCDALDSEQGSLGRTRDTSVNGTFPVYLLEVVLDNGFSFSFDYFPNRGDGCVHFAGEFFASSEQINTWISSHVQ